MPNTDALRVVMFSAEAYPFVKVGGLADVLGSLPKVLATLGADVTVVLPAYKAIDRHQFGIEPYHRIAPFEVAMGPGFARAEIFHSVMPASDVRMLFIGCRAYFSRDGVYDDPITREGFFDNM